MRILCTGDLHLGRRPSWLPDGVDGRRFSAGAAWDSVVRRAIEERVHAVALTGDLIDRENRYFEALGPLEEGLRLLAAADIETWAVAGNHDFDTLPQFAASSPAARLRLLGKGGRWERLSFERDGVAACVHGWSFPSERVGSSPLLGFEAEPGAVNLALLHCDLDQAGSRYASVALHELQARPMTAWLLGHVHRPRLVQGAGRPAVLYPGSPQPLDPSETGPHGPWLLEIDRAAARARQIPLARVRYDELRLDLEGVDSREALDSRLMAALHEAGEALGEDGAALECLALRLKFEGRTALHRELPELLSSLAGQLEVRRGSLRIAVEKALADAQPPLDLAEIARGGDAPGQLAKILLELESGAGVPELDCLLGECSRRLEMVRSARRYQPLGSRSSGDRPDPALARRVLRRQGLRLLEELLGQKEAVR